MSPASDWRYTIWWAGGNPAPKINEWDEPTSPPEYYKEVLRGYGTNGWHSLISNDHLVVIGSFEAGGMSVLIAWKVPDVEGR